MQKDNLQNTDILKELDDFLILEKESLELDNEKIDIKQNEKDSTFFMEDIISVDNVILEKQEETIGLESIETNDYDNWYDSLSTKTVEKKVITNKKSRTFLSPVIFISKYILTSSLLFIVLLISTNYSAYINIAKSYIFAEELKATSQKLISSVEASNIKEKYMEEETEDKEDSEMLSIKKMKKEQDKKDIKLDIEITPYENRIIIPKIGQNIPLIDIKNRNIDGEDELNEIFMKELEKGIIRYPGSAKPGEDGTSFIFGHSSNFPWIKGDYNDVFSLLDKVSYNDEVIVYYGQEKYTYKIKEKKVITPGDVSVLERNKNKSEITLMTCWPIGTTLNRLIVTGELINID